MTWNMDHWKRRSFRHDPGGFIASSRTKSSSAPNATEAEAMAALHSLEFFDGSDVQMGDLPDFRQELDAQVRWPFDG